MLPTLPFPSSVHMSILYVCVSIYALHIGSSYLYSGFHIYMLIYHICFFLSDFTLYDIL